jgi:hypothetical protein
MGTTTFTGPVRSGPILNTSGSTIGADIANVGNAVLAQSFELTQDGTTTNTTIVLPVGSRILSVTFVATVAYSSALDFTVTDTAGSSASLVAAQTPAVGVTSFVPSTLAEATIWTATATDVRLNAVSATAGAGEGLVTVTYVQN